MLAGLELHLTGSFTDAGTQDTHTTSIDWGDGTTTTPGLSRGTGSGAVTDSHVYERPGLYTLIVTITDDDTASDTATASVEVVDAIGATTVAIETLKTLANDASLDTETRAALANALADLDGGNDSATANGALDMLAKGNLNAALEQIKQAQQQLAKIDVIDVIQQQRALALTAKAVVVEALAQAESVATRPNELKKIAQAKALLEAGDALLANGDYVGAVNLYQDAIKKVRRL